MCHLKQINCVFDANLLLILNGQRGVDLGIAQKRGEGGQKARGDGIWHWDDGMSDSEDDHFPSPRVMVGMTVTTRRTGEQLLSMIAVPESDSD
jgi:hypothetical protein